MINLKNECIEFLQDTCYLKQPEWKVQLWLCELSREEIFDGGFLRDKNRWC